MKARKKTEEEYEAGFYGLELPAGAGVYGIARRNSMNSRETAKALRCDAIAHSIAEHTLQKAREFYKRKSGNCSLPEGISFEATYKLSGLPFCKTIVAYVEGEPLSMVKVYSDFTRKDRIVYVFSGDAGPYEVEVA